MRKVKLDDKSGKAGDAFFDDENPVENEALSFADGAKMSKLKTDRNFAGESEFLINALKQLFLFLPGAFLLFFMSVAAAIIAMEIVVFRRPIASLPDDYPFQFALIGLVILLGTFMTWFGLGNIKNKKHFAIPVSTTVTGATLGAIVKAAASISDFADRMLEEFDFLIYLFPLALIVPVLAKSIVDWKAKDASE